MHVLVSGAGIAGPTLAWFLAKAGIRSTVLEKASSLPAQGQNIDIQGSAVFVVEKMGVLDQIRQMNTKEQGTQFVDTNGKPYAQFLIGKDNTFSPTSEYEILRGDLATILYKATANNPLVEYRFGTTVRKVISNDEAGVEVELDDGKVEKYDLLVAADGQWSKIRTECFPKECVRVVDTGLYSAWWTLPRIPADNDLWNIYFGPNSKMMSMRPDPHGTTRAFVNCMPTAGTQTKIWQETSRSDRQTQQELIHKEFIDVGWQADRFLQGMTTAPDFYFQVVQQIKLSKWSISRVVCLGDAGYAPTPLTGMGTSLAINGAYVLAGELSKSQNTESVSTALLAYESKYRPFVEASQKIPPFVPGLFHPGTATKRWFLETFVWTVSKLVAAVKVVPWVGSKVNKPTAQDFPLPSYAAFD
ncbi:MAG: hypothetical protein GOMPHAMPRED_004821 [Gomphillus americanus]|uniref:FAD-binding domain-containing protein n=1 Tax=Gomphillus americanus TaxID=1940652 RepID=A0A8H3I7X8_9LECA|nr:MAG: hypothetical protein GOMPHAMPRED_004821 [Gomphillus americanus]